MGKVTGHITADAGIQFGKPVFKGTRVPVQSLFWHLEKGVSIDNFLQDFPGVSRESAEAVIEWAARYFESAEILSNETIVR